MKAPSMSTAQRTTAIALLVLSLFLLLVLQMNAALAQDSSDEVWVLYETVVDPLNGKKDFVGGGADPTWFPEARFEGRRDLYTVTETAFRVDSRDVDHGYEYHNASLLADFQEPPPILVPGETVPLKVTGSYSGTVTDGVEQASSSGTRVTGYGWIRLKPGTFLLGMETGMGGLPSPTPLRRRNHKTPTTRSR